MRLNVFPSRAHAPEKFCPQQIHPIDELSGRRDSSSSVDSGLSSVGRESDNFVETMYSGGYVTQKRYGLASVELKQHSPSIQCLPPPCQLGSKQVFSYMPANNAHGKDPEVRNILPSASQSLPFRLFGSDMSQKDNNERLHRQIQVPGKNVIDLERIARGLDTRTTVCL